MSYRKRFTKARRRFSSGTKYVKQTFQSFFDFNTSEDTQILTISAGGDTVTKRLSPFFSAFKYAKLGKISIKMVPASTLPVDPTGMSLEEGEPGVNPIDQLSPGLVRITNGDTLGAIPTDRVKQRKIYNNMLLDNRWSKFMLQSGVYKRAKPLVWQVANVIQSPFPDQIERLPQLNGGTTYKGETHSSKFVNFNGSSFTGGLKYGTSEVGGLYQIGKNISMGWLPTDALIKDNDGVVKKGIVNGLPEIPNVITIITPPVYKTKYYYRCYVTETVFFKEPVANFPVISDEQNITYGQYDRFTSPRGIQSQVTGVGSNQIITGVDGN